MFDGFERHGVRTSEVTINCMVGGEGRPVLLLHGYPQTHVAWHRIASQLAERFTVVAADLRGYGDSDKPAGGPGHAAYAKRRMAQDQVEMMSALGFERFAAVGHDRGGRVVERLARDHPERLTRIAILDVIPLTLSADMFTRVDADFGRDTYHWFFLIQEGGLPERLIGGDPAFYLRWTFESWGGGRPWLDPPAFEEYLRCFRDPACIHATCEDYRAGVTCDPRDNVTDEGARLTCPVLFIFGRGSRFGARFDPHRYWRDRAERVEVASVPGGHFVAEEAPDETLAALLPFLAG